MKTQEYYVPHIIIVGGGFGGLQLIKKFKNRKVKVTWFDKNNYHTFQPLLYQVASGGLGPDAIAYPLRKISGMARNIMFRLAEVNKINSDKNSIETSIGEFTYDYLIIATGSQTNFFGNTSLEKNCMQLKSIGDALDLRSDILQEFEYSIISAADQKKVKQILNFVVVGGGPTGVETAGALAEMKNNVLKSDYHEINPADMQVHLIESGGELLSMFDKSLTDKAKLSLEKIGVKVMLNTRVESYDGSTLFLNNGETISTNTVIWSAGVKGRIIEGFKTDDIGRGNRYKVDAFNKLINYENIFAIGDVATMSTDLKFPDGHPQVAPVAIQQANNLANNLQLADKTNWKPFMYFDKGAMATIGRHKAVLQSFGIKMSGYSAWFAWMFLHLMLLVGYRSRIIVFVNWMWNYISYQRAIRIIIRPFKRHNEDTL